MMNVVYERCAGLDVHKKSVTACLIISVSDGSWQRETRTFKTMTEHLLQLANWFQSAQVTHVAIESTGVY